MIVTMTVVVALIPGAHFLALVVEVADAKYSVLGNCMAISMAIQSTLAHNVVWSSARVAYVCVPVHWISGLVVVVASIIMMVLASTVHVPDGVIVGFVVANQTTFTPNAAETTADFVHMSH